jgi:DNA-binding NtrC family response regulator
MPGLPSASTAQHLPSPWRADLPQLATIVCCLVGHSLDEVERELIFQTLCYYHGSRTRAARILGISIRCMRDKIHELEDLGIAVPSPGQREDTPGPRAP